MRSVSEPSIPLLRSAYPKGPRDQWLPDTYEGSPPTITTLLAAGTKKAGFAATIRIVVLGMVVLNLDWTLALGILAIMTMTIGNVAAIMQKNLSRMLAYSSIAHAGYILIGLAVSPYSSISCWLHIDWTCSISI
ncbi:MAG: proton-conducting transporter membrane subunit [Nitrosopumilaceae archaeon]